MRHRDRKLEKELDERYEKHLAAVEADKNKGRKLTIFSYLSPRKHRRIIDRNLRQLLFELQNTAGPFFDRDGHELSFQVTRAGILYVWRHPKAGEVKQSKK